jgi:aspartate-semialdehyde dehydrogenase
MCKEGTVSMMMNATPQPGYTVAVLGATGLVGGMIIQFLQERDFPVSTLLPLASKRTAGGTVLFKGEPLTVVEATPEAFEGVDIVLASAGGSISAVLAPEAVKRGAVVIDNTSHYRMHPNVPLVVGGVNDEALTAHHGIIANPNCSTAQLMPVLKTIHLVAGLKRVIVSTYQSCSGGGKEALDELRSEVVHDTTHGVVEGRSDLFVNGQFENQMFARSIAFNLIPQIDSFQEKAGLEYGYTKEELKLIHETRKILNLPELPVTATAIRVPVLVGHSESVTVECERPVNLGEMQAALAQTPDVVVAQELNDYHTPRETAHTDPVYVSRLRLDTSNPETGLNMWVVSDNLRIGAALNAVRIAEGLVRLNAVHVPETSVTF